MMSLGLMLKEDEAVIWRGPMLMGALQQLLGQVAWGELDVLLVDLPPGTGDIQLTLCQRTQVTGAIVVSTPQDVALLDARKALDMFRKLKTPVLGLIENMSSYVCPNCGHEAHIFGHGGVAEEARRLDVPFLENCPSISPSASRATRAARWRPARGPSPRPMPISPAASWQAAWPEARRPGSRLCGGGSHLLPYGDEPSEAAPTGRASAEPARARAARCSRTNFGRSRG